MIYTLIIAYDSKIINIEFIRLNYWVILKSSLLEYNIYLKLNLQRKNKQTNHVMVINSYWNRIMKLDVNQEGIVNDTFPEGSLW